MSKILIAGNALVIESDYTLEQLKTLEKYQPKALCLYGEDGKNVEFKVATGCDGSISGFGATFADSAHTSGKKAVITMTIPAGVENVFTYVEDKVGLAIVKLNKVEEGFAEALAKVEADKAAIRETVVIVGEEPAPAPAAE